MSLPASGQISLSNFRTEFSQSGVTDYSFDYASTGLNAFDGTSFAPVNVNSANDGNLFVSTSSENNHFSFWYGYNHSAYYTVGSTPQPLYLNILPLTHCDNSSMIIFDLGTSNKTVNIRISGSSANFSDGLINSVYAYYGKPWANNGNDFNTSPGPTNPWGATIIYSASYGGNPGGNWFINGFDVNFDYSYVYNSASGSSIYVVIYSYCP
jgi:hypothetical protein